MKSCLTMLSSFQGKLVRNGEEKKAVVSKFNFHYVPEDDLQYTLLPRIIVMSLFFIISLLTPVSLSLFSDLYRGEHRKREDDMSGVFQQNQQHRGTTKQRLYTAKMHIEAKCMLSFTCR